MKSRRSFLLGSAAAAAQALVPAAFPAALPGALSGDLSGALNSADMRDDGSQPAPRPPNIVIYLADQFRWDFVGANGQNSSTRTPNLDAMAARGSNFIRAVTNQPLCAPARSVVLTSQFASSTGVWRNGISLRPDMPTIAHELRSAGYSANYIGKWHLAPDSPADGGSPGFVKPEFRGGFLDLWEASNLLEFTSHPYEGTIYNADGKAITFKDDYRVDFLTGRAERFLKQTHEKPFLLFISQLEPHQQNDMNRIVGPKGSAERFKNSSVPADLREFPGNWHEQLPDYYGACESIDSSVGRIRKALEEHNLAENTVFVFMSDHGCHFMTRNEEYKRSVHNSSLRVPLIIEGPGFEGGRQIPDVVGLINLAPTLLEVAGVPIPKEWRGSSLIPLLGNASAPVEWSNHELIQISESMTARAIRTRDWTYCVAEPTGEVGESSGHYQEYQLYDQRNDPHELVNLAGRKEYRQTALSCASN